MFDQWQPPLDYMKSSFTNNSPYYPEATELGAEKYSFKDFLYDNPMMLSSFLFPLMKPQDVDSIPSGANEDQVATGPAFTSDVASHQPFNPSFQPLEPAECHPYSPASSPDGSCSDLFGAPKPHFVYSSSSSADNSEVISDVGCSTPIQSSHPRILPDNYSKAAEMCFSNPNPTMVISDREVPANPSFPGFCALSHSRVLPYPSDVFTATGTSEVPNPSVPLMPKVFPNDSNDLLTQDHRNYDGFSRTWTIRDLDNVTRDAGEYKVIQPSIPHSRHDQQRVGHTGQVPTTKIKRFPCPECGQRFARAFNLQTHIATHAGMRPFSCPADGCSKAFSRRHDLGRHVGAVHREWLALRNLSVQEAVKPLRWKNDASKSQNYNARRNQAKREKKM